MTISIATRLGSKLCDALGLDKTVVRSLTLHCGTKDVPTVLVEQMVTDEQGQRIADVLIREFEITEKPCG